jgi:hypothetical protein
MLFVSCLAATEELRKCYCSSLRTWRTLRETFLCLAETAKPRKGFFYLFLCGLSELCENLLI